METGQVFNREYKFEAVKLVTDRGVAFAQLARDPGCTTTCGRSGLMNS